MFLYLNIFDIPIIFSFRRKKMKTHVCRNDTKRSKIDKRCGRF